MWSSGTWDAAREKLLAEYTRLAPDENGELVVVNLELDPESPVEIPVMPCGGVKNRGSRGSSEESSRGGDEEKVVLY